MAAVYFKNRSRLDSDILLNFRLQIDFNYLKWMTS